MEAKTCDIELCRKLCGVHLLAVETEAVIATAP